MPADTSKGMVHLFDDFMGDTINLDLYSTNSDTSGTAFAVNEQRNGVVRGSVPTTDGSITNLFGAILYRPNSGSITLEARATLITSLADGETYIGFTDAITDENPITLDTSDAETSNATDAAGFAYTGAGTADWKAVSVNNGADGTVTRCNVGGATTPVVGTWQTFKVVINSDGDADFYINGVWHYREDLAVAAAVSLGLGIAIQAGGTARSIDLDYVEVWAPRV